MLGRVSILLPLLIWLYCATFAQGQALIVNFPEASGGGNYRGAIADFGFQFNDADSYDARLMLPPEEDLFMCSYPESLDNAPRFNSSMPIALFVRYGACRYDDKLAVALALQEKLSSDIRYVIMYNDNIFRPSEVLLLTYTGLDVDSLGVAFVSTRSGIFTLNTMQKWAITNQQSPFLSANNTKWDLVVNLKYQFWDFSPGLPRGSPRATTAFYWLRYVLFAVLILSPCMRAAYLWFGGGGRIYFRRNDQNRITGLQFVPPAPRWFAPSLQVDGRRGQVARLTEEQVMALPEITFVAPLRRDSEVDIEYAPESEDEDEDTRTGGGIALVEVAGEETGPQVNKQADSLATESPTTPAESPDTLSPAESHAEEPQSAEFTTSCTTCSICIDDFESEERIRLLPRCRHAFHTDCILPWLTERQGCCPLCKTPVIETEDENESDAENNPAQANESDTIPVTEPTFLPPA